MPISDLLESAIEEEHLFESVSIDTSKPRRVYIRGVGYNSPLNTKLRKLGAKWDRQERALWVSKSKADKVKALVEPHQEFRNEMERRRKEKLVYKSPVAFEIKDELKKLGGKWDAMNRVWLMPDKESLRKAWRLGDEAKAKKQREKGRRSASPKQIDLAMSLIQKVIRLGGWHDSDAGQGGPPPTRKDLEKMSSSDVSSLIDSLKGEL